MGCRGAKQRNGHRLWLLNHMVYPTVILLNLLLILLTVSHSTLGLSVRTKENATQQRGDNTERQQIPFHVTILLVGCKGTIK